MSVFRIEGIFRLFGSRLIWGTIRAVWAGSWSMLAGICWVGCGRGPSGTLSEHGGTRSATYSTTTTAAAVKMPNCFLLQVCSYMTAS